MGQSSFDMKFFRLLRRFEIKSVTPTHISRAIFVAVGNVPLPILPQKSRTGEALAGVRKCAVISGQGFLGRALLPSFDKKHNVRIPVKWHRRRNFQGHQRVGS